MQFFRKEVTSASPEPKGFREGVWLILILSAVVRFHDISLPYFWTDEAWTALVSVQSPAMILFHVGHDVHPPLYFLLLHLWIQLFGDSVLALRAMSAVAGILAVALGMWLMRLLGTARETLLAGLFMALLPISVRYSQEARMYALEAALLLGSTIALVYWLRSARDRYLAGYVVLMTAALYTHYLAILCLAAHCLYLVALRVQGDRALHVLSRARIWGAWLIIAMAYVPWLVVLADEVIVHNEAFKIGGEIFWIPAPSSYTLPSAIWRFLTLRSRTEMITSVYLLLPVLVMVSALWVVFTDRSRLRVGLLLLIYSFFPVLATFLASFLLPIFVERYVAFAAIGLTMLLALTVTRVAQRAPILGGIVVLLILGLECAGLHVMYAQQDDLDDPRNATLRPLAQIVGSINERAIPGDTIIVYGDYWYFTVAYHSRFGIQPLLYEPASDSTHDNQPNGYGTSTLIYRDRDRLFLEDLSSLSGSIKRVWWVSFAGSAEVDQPVPANWQCLLLQEAGEMSLRLYSIQVHDVVRQGVTDNRCPRLGDKNQALDRQSDSPSQRQNFSRRHTPIFMQSMFSGIAWTSVQWQTGASK